MLILVVFWMSIGYNISSSKCLVFCYFWTYIYFKRDSYITLWLSSPHFARRIGREGKSSLAVTHLATLGVRRQRSAFRVKKIQKIKEQSNRLLFVWLDSIRCQEQKPVKFMKMFIYTKSTQGRFRLWIFINEQ